jgi:hypothetical protein
MTAGVFHMRSNVLYGAPYRHFVIITSFLEKLIAGHFHSG